MCQVNLMGQMCEQFTKFFINLQTISKKTIIHHRLTLQKH